MPLLLGGLVLCSCNSQLVNLIQQLESFTTAELRTWNTIDVVLTVFQSHELSWNSLNTCTDLMIWQTRPQLLGICWSAGYYFILCTLFKLQYLAYANKLFQSHCLAHGNLLFLFRKRIICTSISKTHWIHWLCWPQSSEVYTHQIQCWTKIFSFCFLFKPQWLSIFHIFYAKNFI